MSRRKSTELTKDQQGKVEKSRTEVAKNKSTKRPTRGISTNPPRSSSQQEPLTSLVRNSLVEDLYGGGKVEKSINPSDFGRLPIQSCERVVQKVVESTDVKRGCQRQVYACMEVAENTARVLLKVGIRGDPEICTKCGLIHIRETRIPLIPPERGV